MNENHDVRMIMWWIKWWEENLLMNNEKSKILKIDIRSTFLKKNLWSWF